MKKRILLTGKEAKKHFRVSSQTLRRWDKLGQIETERTPGGTRRYIIYEDVPSAESPSEEDNAKSQEEERLEYERSAEIFWNSALGKNARKKLDEKQKKWERAKRILARLEEKKRSKGDTVSG